MRIRGIRADKWTVYRTNTFALIHAGVFHMLMNVISLVPLLERFEAENGTLTSLLLFFGRKLSLPPHCSGQLVTKTSTFNHPSPHVRDHPTHLRPQHLRPGLLHLGLPPPRRRIHQNPPQQPNLPSRHCQNPNMVRPSYFGSHHLGYGAKYIALGTPVWTCDWVCLGIGLH